MLGEATEHGSHVMVSPALSRSNLATAFVWGSHAGPGSWSNAILQPMEVDEATRSLHDQARDVRNMVATAT